MNNIRLKIEHTVIESCDIIFTYSFNNPHLTQSIISVDVL